VTLRSAFCFTQKKKTRANGSLPTSGNQPEYGLYMKNIILTHSKNSNKPFPAYRYKPGQPLPPSHIKVDGRETLRRNAEAFEQHQRDEQARMARAGRRAA
jgi:hypothetical protein